MTNRTDSIKLAIEALQSSQDYVDAAANAQFLAGWGEQMDKAAAAIKALADLQAREGEAVAWSDDALNRAYSDGVAYGERNYRQAIATYQAEASGYKDAYFKLVEGIANLKVFEPAPPIIIAAPQPAQPESIECDCGRIHKKTRYGWACSEPAQPEQVDIADIIAGALNVSRGTAYDLLRWRHQPAQPVAQPLTDEDCTRIYNEANNITIKNPPITTARVFAAMRAAHIHGSTK